MVQVVQVVQVVRGDQGDQGGEGGRVVEWFSGLVGRWLDIHGV